MLGGKSQRQLARRVSARMRPCKVLLTTECEHPSKTARGFTSSESRLFAPSRVPEAVDGHLPNPWKTSKNSRATIGLRNMAVEVEILAARLTRIKTLLDALEPVCLQSEASRDTFQKLKLELEAARIAVRLDRAARR